MQRGPLFSHLRNKHKARERPQSLQVSRYVSHFQEKWRASSKQITEIIADKASL